MTSPRGVVVNTIYNSTQTSSNEMLLLPLCYSLHRHERFLHGLPATDYEMHYLPRVVSDVRGQLDQISASKVFTSGVSDDVASAVDCLQSITTTTTTSRNFRNFQNRQYHRSHGDDDDENDEDDEHNHEHLSDLHLIDGVIDIAATLCCIRRRFMDWHVLSHAPCPVVQQQPGPLCQTCALWTFT